jgi:multidrug resistance efflux pump
LRFGRRLKEEIMTRKKTILGITTGLLLVSGVAWTIKPGSDGIVRAAKSDISREIVSPGVVEPTSEQVALAFEIPGRLEEVLVNEGDRVEEGQVLARLDSRLLRARVARAQAALESAKARRDATLSGARKDEIKAAEAEADAARASAWERTRQHARSERLAEHNAISNAELDGAKGSADTARAMADAASARFQLMKEGARTESRREAIAQVAGQEAELEEAKTLLDQTELRAPKSGVILRRLVEPGEQVTTTPVKTVLTLADLDHLQLRVEVDENDVGQVAAGQTGFATADAYGTRRFPGKVVRLMKELGRKTLRADDPRGHFDTRVLEVLFVPDLGARAGKAVPPEDPSQLGPDASSELPLGLRMDVHIQTVARHDVVTLPATAVRTEGERAEVTVLDHGDKTVREVKLGADDGLKVEIASGVSEGELVAVKP